MGFPGSGSASAQRSIRSASGAPHGGRKPLNLLCYRRRPTKTGGFGMRRQGAGRGKHTGMTFILAILAGLFGATTGPGA